MKRIAALIVNLRIAIIVSTIVLTMFFLYFLRNIRINPDVTSYLPKNDRIASLYSYIGRQYGGNQIALIAFETENIFNRETIKRIAELTAKFREVDGISYATSLTSVLDFKKIDDGIEISRLIDEYDLPQTDAELRQLAEYALSRDIYRGRLVSVDTRATVILCRIAAGADGIKISRQLRDIVTQAELNEKVYYGGYPFLINDMGVIIVRDLKLLVPIVMFLIILALYISFRRLRYVVLPVLSVGISSIWTIGAMCLFKIPLTIISNIIPVILVAVGSAYSIHVISKFRENAVDGRDCVERAIASLSKVMVPVFFAAVTTIAGFLSFVFGAYLTMINEFGIFSSLGVFFAFLISVTFVPAMLVVLPGRKGGKPGEEDVFASTAAGSRIIERLAGWIFKYKLAVLIASLVLFVVSMIGIPRIRRQVDILDYFKPGTSTRLAEQEMQERFGGSSPMQVLVNGDIEDPSVLREIKNMENFMKSIPNVHHPQSIADILEEMNDLMGEGKRIPDCREKVSNLWFLIEGEDIMQQLVNGEKTEAVIQATLGKMDAQLTARIIKQIDGYIKEHADGPAKFSQTGMHYIHSKLDHAVLFNQAQSLALALVFVFIVVAFLLRSFAGGLVGLVPIVSALLLVFGIMGFFRIPLDLATMLVGGIAIGTGIDYAIHFTTRFRWELDNDPEPRSALVNTLSTTGIAILTNVITVALGFLILIFANLIPLQRFGILIAIVTVSAGMGSITLLPAVMFLSGAGMDNKRRKK